MSEFPSGSQAQPAPEPDGTAARRFCVTVWPAAAGRHWHAELGAAGIASPLRFDRPIELVLYLTELGGDAVMRHGLR